MDLPKFEFPTIDFPFDAWRTLYSQADIEMTQGLYLTTIGLGTHQSYTSTTVVTGPFAFSTSQEEAVEDWLLSKGYFIEWLDTIRIVSGGNRSRMLSHLRMTGARIYSIKTQVDVL